MRADGHHVGRHRDAAGGHVDDGAVVADALACPGAEILMRKKALDDLKFTVLSHNQSLCSFALTQPFVAGRATKKARAEKSGSFPFRTLLYSLF